MKVNVKEEMVTFEKGNNVNCYLKDSEDDQGNRNISLASLKDVREGLQNKSFGFRSN